MPFLVFLVLAFGLGPLRGVASAQPDAVRVTAREAEVRARASRQSEVVGRVLSGVVLRVLGQENAWYKVVIPAEAKVSVRSPESGYVSIRDVSVETGGRTEKESPAAPMTGGERARAPVRARPRLPVRVRAFGLVAWERFQAVESFKAIYGSPSAVLYGGGVDVSIARRWFVQGEVSQVRRTGERVFVFEGEVFQLGIPQEMTLTPIAVNVGYRDVRRPRRLVPYAGGGISSCSYAEEAGAGGERFSKQVLGYQAIGGVEMRVSRWVAAAVEGGYRHIPGILGSGGVSGEFGEKNLGGFTLGFKALIGR